MAKPQKINSKARCRLCHHRGDEHRPACAHRQGNGVCGCVGIRGAAVQGDKKRVR